MKYRIFGRNGGLRVSEISLGAGNFGAGTGHANLPQVLNAAAARAVFDVYAEAGGNFIDTAEGYQGGRSEEIIGDLIAADRDNFVVASKYSVGVGRTESYAKIGNSRKAMMAAIDGTLRRLKTDHVDLYWLHAHDGLTPIEEILRGLDDLITSGKVLYGGLSNFPAWRISRGAAIADARDWAPITGIQVEYSLAERAADRELLPMAEALGIGVGLWSPLGNGFLTGSLDYDTEVRDTRPPLPHWAQTNRPNSHDLAVRDSLAKVAADLGLSPAAVAYAWLLDKARRSPTSLIPTAGVNDADQLREVLSATEIMLPQDALDTLESVSAPVLGEPHDHNAFHADIVEGTGLIRPALPVA